MAAQSYIVQKCFKDASLASGPALERCVDHAIAQLQVAESMSMKARERDDLAIGWRELQKIKPDWLGAFPRDLLAAFNAPPSAQPAPQISAPTSGLGPLTLVEDDKVAKAIESKRLLQRVLPVVDQVLSELDGMMSTAQGLPNVSPELNPVRPEIFAEVLRRLIDQAPVEPEMRSMYSRFIGEKFGAELKAIYKALVEVLQGANIQSANYRVLQTPASVLAARAARRAGLEPGEGATGFGGLGGGAGSGFELPPPEQYVDLSSYEMEDALFQDFLYHGGSDEQQGLAPSYYAAIDEELAQLRAEPDDDPQYWEAEPPISQEYMAMPAVDRPKRFIDVLSQLSAQVWGAYGRSHERNLLRAQLRKDATRVGQVLGLEVVRKLVNQVAQDPRLLVPVRESIVALEPSLMRLAMIDPRFFSDERHPGRRLMERVAERSFKYNDEFSPQFQDFFAPVAQVFVELNERTIEDVQPFQSALQQLEGLWAEQDQGEQARQHEVLSAMQFAEERQVKADQIAWDMSSRPDLDGVPAVVLDFLYGPWSLAIAHARMLDKTGSVDPMGFGMVVTDLLWSVKREFTLRQPAKLVEMIPRLLRDLHAGLELIGRDRHDDEPFFDALLKLHHPTLKLRREKTRRDQQESGAVPLENDVDIAPATPEQRKARAAAVPWLPREQMEAAGFDDTLPTGAGELTDAEAEQAQTQAQAAPPAAPVASDVDIDLLSDTVIPGSPEDPYGSPEDIPAELRALAEAEAAALAAEQAGPTPEEILATLTTGSWVDLYSKEQWLRAQLIWASTKGTLFMFTSHGGQPHSMTKRTCERLIRERLLRPVDSHAVVAHALESVQREAAEGRGSDVMGRRSHSSRDGRSRRRHSGRQNTGFSQAAA